MARGVALRLRSRMRPADRGPSGAQPRGLALTGVPALRERERLLRAATEQKCLAGDVDLRLIATLTTGLRARDLYTIADEAERRARQADRPCTSMADFEIALLDVLMHGAKILLSEPDERRQLAYHVGGHVLLAWHSAAAGETLGATLFTHSSLLVPTRPQPLLPDDYRAELLARMDILLAGSVAESLACRSVSENGEHDRREALELARSLVVVAGNGTGERSNGSNHAAARSPAAMNGSHGRPTDPAARLVEERSERVRAFRQREEERLHALAELLTVEETVDHATLVRVLGPHSAHRIEG